TQFGHANIRMNRKVDNALSYFIVSPDMHKVHHHHVLPYTDSNYGNIFSIWDRVFGTFRKLDREQIVYGVDTFPDQIANGNIKDLLKQPFHKYRRPTTVKT
ncbi:MAG: sterol desaturase family protein, partial [Aquaticitalea sp.]